MKKKVLSMIMVAILSSALAMGFSGCGVKVDATSKNHSVSTNDEAVTEKVSDVVTGTTTDVSEKNTTSEKGSTVENSTKATETSTEVEKTTVTTSVNGKTKKVWVEPEYKLVKKTVWVKPVTQKVWVDAPVTKEVTVPATTKKVWVKAKTTTIKHPAVTHKEPVYETEYFLICNACGADVTDLIIRYNKGEDVPLSEDHIAQHLEKGEKASWHSEYRQVQTGTKTVVDKKAWTEKKTTPAHYETVTVPATTKTVTVRKGHYETKVITEGHSETKMVKEVVKEGYWKTVSAE